MMHPIDTLLSTVGMMITFLGFCAALLCSQVWIVWTTSVGVFLMALGQGLDKWREYKRTQAQRNWW